MAKGDSYKSQVNGLERGNNHATARGRDDEEVHIPIDKTLQTTRIKLNLIYNQRTKLYFVLN